MNFTRTIYFRVEGNAIIGFGHLVRCWAIAYMLRNDFNVKFYCRSIPKTLLAEFSTAGFTVVYIKNESDFLESVTPEEIIVLDGYEFNYSYQKAIKEKGAKLVCIDDLHDQEFIADLIINQAPGVTSEKYRSKPFTQFALGLDYCLLRPAFLEQAKKGRRITAIETVLLCFGGADNKGLTSQTLKVVTGFNRFRKIIVVSGNNVDISREFTKVLHQHREIDFRHDLNENQMLDTMLEADLAILPSSGLLYEAIAAGCQVMTGISADNQRYVYENFKKLGLIIDAGLFTESDLNNALLSLDNVKTDRKSPIDGYSEGRIRKLFGRLSAEYNIRLRKAIYDDLLLTYQWASSYIIRQYSFNKNPISFIEHKNWYHEKVYDASCIYYLAEYNFDTIGSIRFDIHNQVAVISYLIDPNYQGKGFGEIILKKGIEKLLLENVKIIEKISTISGEVIKSNVASIKSFERLGFIRHDMDTRFRFEKHV